MGCWFREARKGERVGGLEGRLPPASVDDPTTRGDDGRDDGGDDDRGEEVICGRLRLVAGCGISDGGSHERTGAAESSESVFITVESKKEHKSCGEAAELGVLGFLLWIASGGMVWSLDSSKRRADSTPNSAPPPPAMKLEVEEPLDEKHISLQKRVRDVSTSYEQTLYNNVLGESGPLGKTLCFTSSKGSEVGEQSDFSASSSSLSKIKALNFPSLLLRIGTWECVSRYEGDLVAKCYLAKQKLVWEVLEGGFKSKIEFYWSDITAIKAVFFEGKTLYFTSLKGSEVGEQSDFSASSSSLSKIKALNFPSSLLRIGTWECVSRYEGDLVAKCYLAKHKLVWEVLEGGLKSKIEFYWSDITAIKAHKSCGEAAELGVLGFLLWISSGEMVWSLDSSKRRADSTPHSAPPPPAMKLEVEEPLDEKHAHLHKRVRDVSTSYEQVLYNNVLGEPGPLGKTLCFTSSKGSEVGEQSDFSASSSSLSKIKALNFPSSLLRIGTWECVSRYEGDLVAKCYLTKHKLVWEVLEGGLKSKIEFYWSDITAIKAHKSYREAAELGVLGFLLWISSGGMVWSLDSNKRRADSTPHSAPPPPAMKLEVEEPLDEMHVRLHMSVRDVSTLYEQALYNNVLGEPGPLAAELGVLGFLLWISSGGMVWSLDSNKRRADSTPHSAPPPPAMKLEVEEPLDVMHVRLHMSVRDVSTSYEQALYNNVLGELGPLGIRPRKSPSLAYMI
ncbi:hypothetical protein ZIOFF_043800 [Zingiber officinale]|uniref:TRF2/HOY1 PH-like domain-containing protein n=1 Tax=Zingiber officinale TaxID=94328 RepID=A0A8J5FVM3_ZINOF|nr:hypothetical protein ZIOFF_043800 [Zingiber officinale]